MTAALLTLFVLLHAQPSAALPAADASRTIELDRRTLEVFTYKPKTYKDGPLLVVFHGVKRNADEYRDFAKGMGDRFGALIVAPRFDVKQFPTEKYQRGGLLRGDQLAPKAEWTWNLVPKLVDVIRKAEKRPDMPYYLIGHSGGGQFLVRLAGFVKTDALRIVAANPGTHLFPTDELPYPYGFGKLPGELRNDAALQRYFAQPLTIYLGTADIVQDKNFEKTELANQQGMSRYERGKNAFNQAQRLAKKNGWTFNWRLVEAPDIGHDAKRMFDHANSAEALFGKKQKSTDRETGLVERPSTPYCAAAWQDPERFAALLRESHYRGQP